MRIGIDARLYGLEHAGLGRYVMQLVMQLLKRDKKNEYILFVNKKYEHEFDSFKNATAKVVDIPIYSFREQLILPFIFRSAKLDILHVPHFNAPLLYRGKLILTVHDLIKHYSKGPATTTRQPWLYAIKRLGYLILTKLITSKASLIIVPTQFVKNDLGKMLGVDPKKVEVTYEAVSSNITKVKLGDEEKRATLKQYELTQPFIIYTGSVYPHKNVELLIDAVEQHNKEKEADLMLAIVCARSVFHDRLVKKIKDRGLERQIKMLGFVSDDEVSKLYSLALCLVHPSKMEGFGLTGLEAMKVGLPVISARSSCLPEVYGDAAVYFDPDSAEDLVSVMDNLIQDRELREHLMKLGPIQSGKFSWGKMAKETIGLYKKVNKI